MGWWKYTQFYLGSGIAANAFETLSTSGAPLPSLGASGAIAGLMGGFLILYPHTRIKILYWIWVQAGTFYIPAWAYLGFWFAKEYLFLRVSDLGSGIAFGAHVGGFTVGAIWMWAFYGWNQGQSLEVDYLTQPEESEEAW
ncbi:rhomboid family intramembrane serine protease [Candidatus Sumerlaeota bacterium]|nr:rhomboid family intramembrane serine protease [Candidatus Sumerlaeota bacterium]